MPRRPLTLFLAVLLAFSPILTAAPKRRAAAKPALDHSSPAAWLAKNAHVLHTVEPSPVTADLEPLRTLIGSATVVGLGDGTHGTREFYTVKLRLLEWLVREKGFDVLSFEGPFPLFERINRYVQRGEGDIREILTDGRTRLAYVFWDVEEMLAVIEWVRAYNRTRGSAPAIEIAGFDIFDADGGMAGVLEYLVRIDPAAAAQADRDYQCVRERNLLESCRAAADAVRDRILANRHWYELEAGTRAFENAVRYAETARNYSVSAVGPDRDEAMAANARWIREHRGRSGRMMMWAHQEHLSRTRSTIVGGPTLGTHMAETFGANYFVIATLGGHGSFLAWQRPTGSSAISPQVLTLDPPPAGSYESQFQQHGADALLIPLRGTHAAWLSAPATFRVAGNSDFLPLGPESLPEKWDAVIYIDAVTPTTPLP